MAQLKQMINKNKFYIIGTLILFLFLFYCSTKLCMNVAPDEYMRYDIPLFIYNHSYLPKGDEKEILNAIWGFSYGFTPYLPSIISFFFMKIASIFTTTPVHLLIAARLTSVLAGALTFFVCCKIGEEIFNHKMTIYLFAIFVSLLPQFMYLSLYLNNDSFSIFATALIVYGWIKGIKTNWNCKWCIFLGVAIGICALTYYNAYGFILCSIIVYCMSSYKLHFTFNEFLKKGFLIAIAALVVGGWFFIRNAMIHNGDFLGMNSMYDCGEKYAMPGYQLSQRDTYQNQGISVFSMIFDTNWIITTIKSFICTTGYMQYMISGKRFYLYLIIILFGMIMMLIALKRKYQFKFKFENYPANLCSFLSLCNFTKCNSKTTRAGYENAKQHLNKTFLAREICDCSDLCRRHDLTVHVAGLNHELTVGILCKLVQDSCRSDLILVGNSQSGCAFENLGHTLDLGAFDSTLEKSILNDSVLNAGFTQFLTELCVGLCSDTLVVYDNTGYAVSDLILQLSNNCLLCFQNAFTGQNIHLAFQL